MNDVCHRKIMHIASGDLWAGAEVQLFTLAKSLHTRLGTTISVVLLNHGELEHQLRATGIEVIVLDESQLNGLQILRQLVRTIRDVKPEVVHTHRLKENILGSIAAWICRRIPSLRTAHGAPEHRPSWKQLPKRLIFFLDWFCGRYLQRKIIAVSDDLAGILGKTFPAEKICVIENGIDFESVHRRNNKTHTIPDTQTANLKVGFAGRLVPVKRVDLFIQTARYILDHYPDLKTSFHIFGDGPLREQLEQLSRDLATDRIVHFEGHCNNIHEELQKLDVLLMTSDHEGLPMILLEAMALELPHHRPRRGRNSKTAGPRPLWPLGPGSQSRGLCTCNPAARG
ncbi:MAG: glycosyltransferase [Gammaproteobacteria bacterium]|nr:glycosyltransferase [Gammaproteobacteria bacterium]